MKRIELTKGKFAVIDDDAFKAIGHLKWTTHINGRTCYAERNIRTSDGKRKHVSMHHAIMGFPLNGCEVDHIDGDGLNNRRNNLRIVTHRENCFNNMNRRNAAPLAICLAFLKLE